MTDKTNIIYHELRGQGETSASNLEVQPNLSASPNTLYLTNLMSEVALVANLRLAFKAVKRNKGAPGIDNMSVKEVNDNLEPILNELTLKLLDGTYRPCLVRGVQIPKENGKRRQLGIPTVIDRTVQQAIVQVLTKIYDPTFSNSSFGFRPKRSANMAVKTASNYVKEGNVWVVDIDLEQFFDRVNHDILMSKLAKTIADKALLRLIRRFLTAGLMQDGICKKRDEGTPQGGPLSPLLSNILLHSLDQELERRGHKFCRYADDCNIYVKSEVAAKRVLASISIFLKDRLKLTVNKDKSAASKVIRSLTKRNRGVSLELVIKELNQAIRGWYHYFKDTKSKSLMTYLDAWIRRRIRCFKLKQRKRKYAIKTMLTSMAANQQDAWAIACSNVGWWRKSLNRIVHKAMNLNWFYKIGLFSLSEAFGNHISKTAVCEIARTVV